MCKCFPSFDQKTCDSLVFVYLNYCFVAVNIMGLIICLKSNQIQWAKKWLSHKTPETGQQAGIEEIGLWANNC